jgi:hypothetical protein
MRPWPLGLTAALLLPLPASAQSAYLNALAARPLGPATMSGRITSLAVVERRPLTQYVGSAGGGVWKTTDNGQTWKFAGTEFGLVASLDGGTNWLPVRGIPPAAVHDLAVHPRDGELVIATHGRGLFVLDIAPLQELSARVLAAPVHLFDVKPATLWRPRPARPTPVRSYVAPNPPEGALLSYALKVKAAPALRLAVVDSAGRAVVELPTPPGPGCTRSTGTCAARAAAGCRRGSTPSGSRLASRC